MTTQENNTQRMKDSLKRARADVASLADWIECELDKDSDERVTWATVGSLEHVREQLIDALAFLSGFEKTEIQRSLDELHM